MKEGEINGHNYRWVGNRLTCITCKRGAEVQRYWLTQIQQPCRGVRLEGADLHKAMLAKKIGVQSLDGDGPWRDPYTGHEVRITGDGWLCQECGECLPFGTKGARLRLGKRQQKCGGRNKGKRGGAREANEGRG